jgi:hypothetical protein
LVDIIRRITGTETGRAAEQVQVEDGFTAPQARNSGRAEHMNMMETQR